MIRLHPPIAIAACWLTAMSLAGAAHAAAPQMSEIAAKDLYAQVTAPKAKLTVVNLWASFCEPCKAEMPELIELRKRTAGLDLVLLDADLPEDRDAAVRFLDRMPVDFPVYRTKENAEAFMKTFEKGWPAIVPTTMLFANGKRLGYWVGRVKIKELESKMKTAASSPSPAPAPTGKH